MSRIKNDEDDLGETLRRDRNGVALRRLRGQLIHGRDRLARTSGKSNVEAAAQAYDSGLSLLTELWRLEQRR